jgi:subtilisin family serine protease
MSGRKRAGLSSVAGRCATITRVELALEKLEELLLFSTTPAAPTDWRDETFSIGSLDQQVYGTIAGQAGAMSESALPLIGGDQAQQQYGYTGTGYSVAILDTGIDYNNPAFAGRYLGGWNFVANNNNPMDDNGHGTHVAGIIASDDPNHLGVAPGVDIIALKVLDSTGTGDFGNVDLALQWVAAHQQQYHIAAVNMSLGTGNFATSEPWNMLDSDFQTLRNEGVFVAASSGNSYYSYGSQPGLAFPAINNLVVSVGAVWNGSYGSVTWADGAVDYTSTADQITSFTQRSPQLDILAPGAFITSTYLNDTYATMAGTSMASPVVAGAAVDIMQALTATGHANLATPQEILSIMQDTGVSIVDAGDGQDNVIHTGLTFKRLDLLSAIESIVGSSNIQQPDPPAPSNQSADESYVEGLYQELLGRSADPGGLSNWVAALEAGLSRFNLVQILWDSTEHRADEIEADYNEFLHRSPSTAEVNGWLAVFAQGVGETTVVSDFVHSAEYLDSIADNSAFVQEVFQDLLGRSADPASLASLVSGLDSGMARSQLVNIVLDSPERTAHLIGQYYEQYLGRAGSDTEIQNWANLIALGQVDFETLAEIFLSSNEYFSVASAGTQSAVLGKLDVLGALVATPGGSATSSVNDAPLIVKPAAADLAPAAPGAQVAGIASDVLVDETSN